MPSQLCLNLPEDGKEKEASAPARSMPSVAMLAVWMTRAVHMKGRKVRMVEITSGLLVNSAGKNITMHPAHKLKFRSTTALSCLSWEISLPANRVL